jgi:anti-sigma factor ChrR (cupin superfamily)
MLSHQSIHRSLDAYVDGTLHDSQRAEVDAHLQTCAECEKSVREIRRLDLVLDDLSLAPSIPFPRFWSKLQERLPNKVDKRAPFSRPGRVAAAFALAVFASLVGVVALASDGVMPDSPLYSVKHARQEVQLALAASRERPRLELILGKQRLHEALVMVQRKRHDLALASLRDFQALLVDATSQLEKAPGDQSDTAVLVSSVTDLETELEAVRNASTTQEESKAVDIAALDVAVHADLNAVSHLETRVYQGGTRVVESPSPSAESSPSAHASELGATETTQPATAPSPTTEMSSPSPSDEATP